jgi:cytidine deaminase
MDYCPPCGACRQLLNDYAPHLNIILTDGKNYKTYKINELLPMAFDDSQLPE